MNTQTFILHIISKYRFSQKNISKACGMKQQIVSRWKTGKSSMKFETAFAILDKLDIDKTDFFTTI